MPLFEVRREHDGAVLNVVELHEVVPLEDGFALVPFEGDAVPAEFRPVPASLSAVQLASALKGKGVITAAEALAWVRSGTLPKAIKAGLARLADTDARFDAELLLSGMSEARRLGPEAEALGLVLGYDAAALDDIWRRGGD